MTPSPLSLPFLTTSSLLLFLLSLLSVTLSLSLTHSLTLFLTIVLLKSLPFFFPFPPLLGGSSPKPCLPLKVNPITLPASCSPRIRKNSRSPNRRFDHAILICEHSLGLSNPIQIRVKNTPVGVWTSLCRDLYLPIVPVTLVNLVLPGMRLCHRL